MLGTIPTSLSTLTKLTSMQLNGNKLTGSKYYTMPCFMNNNCWLFEGTIPTGFGSLTKLSLLFLYGNSLIGKCYVFGLYFYLLSIFWLVGVIPHTFSSLVALSSFQLNSNCLSGISKIGLCYTICAMVVLFREYPTCALLNDKYCFSKFEFQFIQWYVFR